MPKYHNFQTIVSSTITDTTTITATTKDNLQNFATEITFINKTLELNRCKEILAFPIVLVVAENWDQSIQYLFIYSFVYLSIF